MDDTRPELPASLASHTAEPGHHENHARRRSAHHTLLFRGTKKRTFWLVGATMVLLVGVVVAVAVFTEFDWNRMMETIEGLDPVAVLPLMALLPIAGFPIMFVYLIAGARFGPLVGGLVVAACTAVHLLGTNVIGRSFLRGPVQRFIERRHFHLPQVPEDEQVAVAVIATLVPGLPYFVRNYVMALAGLRLRVFFLVALPIYVARSYVTILLGDLGSDPSRHRLVILVLVDVLKVAICAYVIWRLRQHHRKYHGSGGVSDAVGQPNAPAK